MTGRLRVVVHGALGRMGREVVSSLGREPDLQVVGGVDKAAASNVIAGSDIPLFSSLGTMLASHPADVVVDFSVADASIAAARVALKKGVSMVIGTTGLTPEDVAEIEQLCKAQAVGAVIASNFTVGAVLLIHLSKIAARHFDYAEIIELHHELKLDAPSGTAITTAKAMAQARGKPFQHPVVHKETLAGTRGGELEGVAVHSIRLPGLLAHQEVVFGGPGQTLTVRHDTLNRECYMPGVALAVREVVKRKGLTLGLEKLLGLE